MKLTLSILGAALCAAAASGCVERKITIASDPPGALVYVNDTEMGRTPVTFPFTWYGDYDVRLRLEKQEGTGETARTRQWYLHTSQRAAAPPYEWVVVDFFSEVLPMELKDEKVWAFIIPEVQPPSDADLIDRAQELKGHIEDTTGIEKVDQARAAAAAKAGGGGGGATTAPGATHSGAGNGPAATRPATTRPK